MEPDKESKFIIGSVIIVDIVILNFLFSILSFPNDFALLWETPQHYIILTLCYLVSVTTFGGVKLHRRRVRADQIVTSVAKNIIGFTIIWFISLWASSTDFKFSWSMTQSIATLITLTFLAISAFRLCYQGLLKGARRRGGQSCDVVFVGSKSNIRELYKEMVNNETGYRVLGYFDTEQNEKFEAEYLGKCEDVVSYLEKHEVQRLYCSLPSAMKDIIVPIITHCERHLTRFYSVPNLRNYLSRRVNLEQFSNTPVLSIHPEPLAKLDNRCIKRIADVIFSGIFLVTLFPIILLIFGILIKATSKGPIFFSQKRHGLDGREFKCLKFRSMKNSADANTKQATKGDPRVTKIGEFMRKTSIDELPQFLNVFIGQMSIVGPRPHMIKHTEEYSKLIDTYMVRHFVKPGVTGWAQVTGFRGETKELSEMEGRVKADIWYMEHWTFMLDLYIIYKTVANVIAQKDDKAF
ncbi:MAG: undecaprenyl-phosphate glucose phosphotransferase [Rikenellaceae bacterium]